MPPHLCMRVYLYITHSQHLFYAIKKIVGKIPNWTRGTQWLVWLEIDFKMHLNVQCICGIGNERPIHTMNRILSVFVMDSLWHCTKQQSPVFTYQRTPLTAIKPNDISSFEFSTTSLFCLNRLMVADQTGCNTRGMLQTYRKNKKKSQKCFLGCEPCTASFDRSKT